MKTTPVVQPLEVPCYLEEDLGPLYIRATHIAQIIGEPDPISLLWTLTRLGDPLFTLINILSPQPEEIAWATSLSGKEWQTYMDEKEITQSKDLIYKAIMASRDLKFNQTKLFTITELYHDNMSGFYKILFTYEQFISLFIKVGIVKEIKRDSGYANSDGRHADHLSKVFQEILKTELDYVADLKKLLKYRNYVLNFKIINRNLVGLLFANLPALVDFQLRFSICLQILLEENNDLKFRIGALFVQYESEFSVYEGFCRHYNKALEMLESESSMLKRADNLINSQTELSSYLIKPIQRICKLPLLMKDIIKNCNLEEDSLARKELDIGLVCIKRAIDKVNEVNRLQESKELLENSIEDWEGLDYTSFGDLYLKESFEVTLNELKREFIVFVFERIILCVRESQANTRLSKFRKGNGPKTNFQIKVKIWITNLSGVVNCSQNEGEHNLKLFWRKHEMESFIVHCQNKEQKIVWKSTLESLIEQLKEWKKLKQMSIGPSQSPSSSVEDSHNLKLKPPRPNPPRKSSIVYTPVQSARKSLFDDLDSPILNSDKMPLPSRPKPPPMLILEPATIVTNNSTHSSQSLRRLSLKNIDPVSPISPISPSISTPPIPSKYNVADLESPTSPRTFFKGKSSIKVKLFYQQDRFALIITDQNLSVDDLFLKVKRKIKINRFLMKYQNQRDFLVLDIDSDLHAALALAEAREDLTLNLYVVAK